ncbi:MAG: 6,7-dimethyl-8-ribityllumazine synthase [Bacteroidota bacterium]|nr:6,7-dimethyl-8-ribityllumazine synthase [Bacteroidota bacterium]
MASVNENLYNFNPGILSKDACIVIVHTEWNADIVSKLLEGCIKMLESYGMNNYKVLTVPGAFEISFAIKSFWETYQNKFEKPQVFIALGCVLRGDTPHFDYVCKAVTDGVVHLNFALPVPTIFGVLTVDNQEQADERIGGKHGHKGEEAALSALKMMSLKYSISNLSNTP